MAFQMYHEADCDITKLDGKKVAVIATAPRATPMRSTSRTQASTVKVGLVRGSKSKAKAEAQGLEVVTNAEAAKWPTSS